MLLPTKGKQSGFRLPHFFPSQMCMFIRGMMFSLWVTSNSRIWTWVRFWSRIKVRWQKVSHWRTQNLEWNLQAVNQLVWRALSRLIDLVDDQRAFLQSFHFRVKHYTKLVLIGFEWNFLAITSCPVEKCLSLECWSWCFFWVVCLVVTKL